MASPALISETQPSEDLKYMFYSDGKIPMDRLLLHKSAKPSSGSSDVKVVSTLLVSKAAGQSNDENKRPATNVPQSLILKVLHPKAIQIARKLRIKMKNP